MGSGASSSVDRQTAAELAGEHWADIEGAFDAEAGAFGGAIPAAHAEAMFAEFLAVKTAGGASLQEHFEESDATLAEAIAQVAIDDYTLAEARRAGMRFSANRATARWHLAKVSRSRYIRFFFGTFHYDLMPYCRRSCC
jgi:hypothetical protein